MPVATKASSTKHDSMIYTYISNKKEDPAYQCMFIHFHLSSSHCNNCTAAEMSCQSILSLAFVVHMDTKSSMCNFLHSCEETFRVGLLPCFQAKQIPTHISRLSRKCTLNCNVPSVKILNIKGRLPIHTQICKAVPLWIKCLQG